MIPIAPATDIGHACCGQGAVEPRSRPVHAFDLVDPEGAFRSFDPRDAIKVAAWLRHATHLKARGLKLDDAFVEDFVCGHGEDAAAKNDRFSYLPLPTIPYKGRDGHIRRVLLAEPFGPASAKARAVVRRLAGAALVEEGVGEVAHLRAVEAPRDEAVFARYLPRWGATRWGSATPIVLPGRDGHRSRKAHGLVLKALAQAGYIAPVAEIQLQTEPVFLGAEMARAYRVPAYLKEFPRAHAVLTFAAPVRGPLALGAGRHVGLGLFAALD